MEFGFHAQEQNSLRYQPIEKLIGRGNTQLSRMLVFCRFQTLANIAQLLQRDKGISRLFALRSTKINI